MTQTDPTEPGRDLRAVPDNDDPRAVAEAILFEVRRVIVGQDAMLERILVGLLCGGHILLEGVPGLAKTLTIKTLADVLGGSFKRVQFTPDLMPSDLVGTRIYRPSDGSFQTELGPVFANFLLADEINRAPAKVQSALLEVMQERQVTIGGVTHDVPAPFIVLATENPIEAEGTYPLPEAQVDRFMLKIVLGYPSATEEAQIVARSLRPGLPPREILDADGLAALQRRVEDVYVDPRIISYAVGLVEAPVGSSTGARRSSPRTSAMARARVGRSTWSQAPAPWRCCAAVATRSRPMSRSWRQTSCATGSCSRTRH